MGIKENILYLSQTEINSVMKRRNASCDPPKFCNMLCDWLLIGIKVNFDYFIQWG
jgi:hypothetical protein